MQCYLILEVDECFAELGRQMQREAKARQDFEQNLKTEMTSADVRFEFKDWSAC